MNQLQHGAPLMVIIVVFQWGDHYMLLQLLAPVGCNIAPWYQVTGGVM